MKIKELIETNFKPIGQTLGIFLLAASLIILGIIFPKSGVRGDATQDNTAGTWQGTIGPKAAGTAGADIDQISASIGVGYNTTFSRYEASLASGQTSGFMRSTTISPANGTLKNWKKIKFGFVRPTSGSATVTVDILCGDPTQTSCPTLDQPISGYSNITLNASDEYDIPTSLLATAIKLRVNFNRTVATDQSVLLYDWQVFWEVNSGVSLTISKTPNPANPQGSTPSGIGNNHTVTYTLSYSLNRSVQNFTIEFPHPTGCYQPGVGGQKEYTVTYLGSGGGGSSVYISGQPLCSPKYKVVWNLGNKSAGTTGLLTATFRVNTGPPNGTILKSKAKILGSDLSALTLPDDLLNIQSRAFMYAYIIRPEYVTPNKDVTYFVGLNALNAGPYYQSDLFNVRYEFNYSNCLLNTSNPTIKGSGATNIVYDNTNRKVAFYLPSPQGWGAEYRYAITIRSASSCGSPTFPASLTIYSDQDANNNFYEQKTTTSSVSTWDATSTPRLSFLKYANPYNIGAGQLVTYGIWMEQKSTQPVNNFYLIDKIPSNVTFLNAKAKNWYIGEGVRLQVPNYNNWKIYWSSYAGAGYPPQGSHTGGWNLCGGNPPESICTVPSGQEGNVKWIKYEPGTFNWDRQRLTYSEYPPTAEIQVVTNPSANGTIDNEIKAYASNICQTGCTTNYSQPVSNNPAFYGSYTTCSGGPTTGIFPSACYGIPTLIDSGNPFWVWAGVQNSTSMSNGDANNVQVTVRLPDRQYLDPTNPIDPTSIYSLCYMPSSNPSYTRDCPDGSNDGTTIIPNAPWTNPYNNPVGLRPSDTCPSGGGSGSCNIVFQIPVLYSYNRYPAKHPFWYHFIIKAKTKFGLPNNQLICQGVCYVTNITSTPTGTTYPPNTTSEIKIVSNPELKITKTNLTPTTIPYGGSVQFKITYSNTSNGASDNAVVIDAIPNAINPIDGSVPDVTPLPRMVYTSYTAQNGESVYFMTNRSRNGPAPMPDDPAWQSITNVAGNENIVDWVMWRYNSQFNSGQSHDVTLTLTDTGSPNGTVFQNLAYISFLNGSSYTTPSTFQYIPALAAENAGSRVTVLNPGFSSTNNGDVGSIGGFSFREKSNNCMDPTPTQCTTTYLGISGDNTIIDSNIFGSAKGWLLSDYEFATQSSSLVQPINYAKMYKDYGREAVACTSEVECLSGSEKIKIFNVTSGNPFKLTASTNNYSGVPRLLFIDSPGGGDALEINNNFTLSSNTALIFIVNGNVKINYGVELVEGVFLVDGQFATGRRLDPVSNKEAGKFATISIGQDGFARIAYISENNVRFIKCKDLDCGNRDYGYVTTASNVVSLSMDLHAYSANVDYPKIVVSQIDTSLSPAKATTKFINCYDKNSADGTLAGETCLDNDTKTYTDTKDSDITVVSGFPAYVLGSGVAAPRAANYAVCAPDPNCLNPNLSQIDGGTNGEDKGNEINISYDITATPSRLVASYVDRSLGKSDLWMAKFNPTNTGVGCFGATSWDCRRITNSPGNIGLFPSSDTPSGSGVYNGRTRFVYQDTSTNEIKYFICSSTNCDTGGATSVVDCTTVCSAQPYISFKNSLQLSFVAYNTLNNTSGTPHKEVKLALCLIASTCNSGSFIKHNLTNNAVFSAQNAVTYNQSVAFGIGSENQMPRVVFYNEDDKSLYYIRCKANVCDPSNSANLSYKKLDNGSSIALPDKPLVINGSVVALGNNVVGGKAIALERDLFAAASLFPAETFNYQPRYYYLLFEIIKEPEFINNLPP